MRFGDLSVSSKQILVSVVSLLIMAAVTIFAIWKMGTLKDGLIAVSDIQLSSDVVADAEHTDQKAVSPVSMTWRTSFVTPRNNSSTSAAEYTRPPTISETAEHFASVAFIGSFIARLPPEATMRRHARVPKSSEPMVVPAPTRPRRGPEGRGWPGRRSRATSVHAR